jgi:hypothetical protein
VRSTSGAGASPDNHTDLFGFEHAFRRQQAHQRGEIEFQLPGLALQLLNALLLFAINTFVARDGVSHPGDFLVEVADVELLPHIAQQ